MCEQHVTINIVLRMLLWSGLEVCRMQGFSHIPVWMSLEKWQDIPMSTKPSAWWGPTSCFSVRRFSNQQEQYYSMTLCQSRIVIECTFGQLKARFGALKLPMDRTALYYGFIRLICTQSNQEEQYVQLISFQDVTEHEIKHFIDKVD